MKSNKQIYGVVCGFVLCATAFLGAPAPAHAQQADRLAECDHYMGAYARSSARKLSRALAGQSYTFSKLPQRSTLQAQVGDDERRFELFFEHDGAAAGVVEKTRTFRTTYAMVSSDKGPVIASHRWPTRQAISAGEAECKPVSSTIVYPQVPVAQVDVDPFKLWGLRVMWHLPTDIDADVASQKPIDAVRKIIEDGGAE